MLGYDTVQAALDSWDAQTCRDDIEILILCPTGLGPSPAQQASLPPRYRVLDIGTDFLHKARARGVHHARGEYLVLAEDHCVPDPDFARAILDRLAEGWDAAGPALRPGNRTLWAGASFLIGYGEWMRPVDSGPSPVLCGWNGTFRTESLQGIPLDELAREMRVGAFLVPRLARAGARFFLESQAQMRHFDPPGCWREWVLMSIVGLGFGAVRTRTWSWPARLAYALAWPAVGLLHAKRAFVHYRRAGRAGGLAPAHLLAAAHLALIWALGESVGALLGPRAVEPYLWRTEVKPVSRRQAAEAADEPMAQSAPSVLR
jgi:hypothetical protein